MKSELKAKIDNAKTPEEMASLMRELLGESNYITEDDSKKLVESMKNDTSKMSSLLSSVSRLGQDSLDIIFAKDNTDEFKQEIKEATTLNIPTYNSIFGKEDKKEIPKKKEERKELEDLSKEEVLNTSVLDLLK